MNEPALGTVAWWFSAAGVLVTLRAVIELAEPAYWSPVSVVDYAAVVGTTVAWLVTAVGIFGLARVSQLRRATWVLMVAALGIATSAVGNLLEDLSDVSFGADLFVWGGMIGAVGLLVAGILVLTVRDRLRLCGLFLLAFLVGGIFPDDGGQFLSGAALLGLGAWLLVSYRTAVDTERT